jgi:hypothetical protein
MFLAGLALNVVGPFPIPDAGETPADPRPSAVEIEVEGPFADDVVARPPVELVHPPSEPRLPPFGFGVVCGHRVGTAVQVMACGRARAELLGFYVKPPERIGECLGSWFSRKQSFSVCWIDLAERPGPPLDHLRLPDVHVWDLVT